MARPPRSKARKLIVVAAATLGLVAAGLWLLPRPNPAMPKEYPAAEVSAYAAMWSVHSEQAAYATSPALAGPFDALVIPSGGRVAFDAEIPSVRKPQNGSWRADLGEFIGSQYIAPVLSEPTLDFVRSPGLPPLVIPILVRPRAESGDAPRELPTRRIWFDTRTASNPGEDRAYVPPLVERLGPSDRFGAGEERLSAEQVHSDWEHGPRTPGIRVPSYDGTARPPRAWIRSDLHDLALAPPVRTVRLGPLFPDPDAGQWNGRTLVGGLIEMRASAQLHEGVVDRLEPKWWNGLRSRMPNLPRLATIPVRHAGTSWRSRRIFDRYTSIGGRRRYMGTVVVWGDDYGAIRRPLVGTWALPQNGVPGALHVPHAALLWSPAP